jgi:FAD/FMN-containing dehydrogenase
LKLLNKWAASPSYQQQRIMTARANAELEMCDKCVELDGKIEHYERLSASINDQLTIDRIKELVEQMKAQKAALHPE